MCVCKGQQQCILHLIRWLVAPAHFIFTVPLQLTIRDASGKSVKAKLLLDQLKSLRGKVITTKLICLDLLSQK